MFDFMTGFGERRTPFYIKDVFDMSKDTFMGY